MWDEGGGHRVVGLFSLMMDSGEISTWQQMVTQTLGFLVFNATKCISQLTTYSIRVFDGRVLLLNA